ncbi:uncharacterized protein F4812DRAFT_83304 [Daldinia caldariorum]|uniref:uncharacterized protein n=1 Tax=Daldinia caldariorum TaxID=326644 RepID=UPI0020072E0D|nr:uncharacterized protein F4812DRAFT_83304 [Daldinia caldariorum]KAI1466552.1 hypothetical protein F4812DRAFT_83304 [Daldinia caldariorum]
MHVQPFLSALVLAACVSSGPIGQATLPLIGRAPSNVCVLIDGDDPYILDPFNRPPCACNCIKQACKQSDPAQTELCLRTPWPPSNAAFPDTLVRYAACVGGTHCVG